MKSKFWLAALLLSPGMIISCQGQNSQNSSGLDRIRLPEGFHIEVYAENVPNARAMDLAPGEVLFVGSREKGNIYAVLKDKKVITLDKGLNMPAGIDFYEGDLYVSAVSRILKYPGILNNLNGSVKPEVIYDKYPADKWHGWKFIKFGPDGKLYVPVGAPCNVCLEDDPVYASITRINRDGSGMEVVAGGIRNTVGFDWDPATGNLWFTDNGRDNLGDEVPPDELNELTGTGQHFGFPFVHGDSIRDPDFWSRRPAKFSWVMPRTDLSAHVAALGMRFYHGKMFPEHYNGGIFIAEHGSWNRSKKTGYRIIFVPVVNGVAGPPEIFASGWLQGEEAWGRPVDVEIMPDGSMLVSDDFGGKIFRIYYQ